MEGPDPAPGGVAPARDASGDAALAMAILEPSQLFIARLTTSDGRVVDVEVPAYVAASGFGRPVQTYDALVFWSAVETRVRWAHEHGGRDHFMVLLPSGKQSVRIVSLGAQRWAVEWHPSEPVGVEEAPPYSQSFSDDQRLATVLLDDGAIITWANERFGKLTDLDGELSGQDLRSVLPADMRISIDDLLRAAIDTGTADRLVPSVQPIPRWLRVRASSVTQVVSGKPLVVLRIEDVSAPEDGPADWTDEIVRDPLTGLYNRRAFFDIAALDDPLDSPFVAVLLADVRRFRRINDGWGQTVADLALAEVAKWLRRAAVSSDVLIRMAGDQFIALCTSGSQLIAELEASPEIPVASAASPLLVTVNAGWAVRRPGQSLIDAAERAERAMDAAKASPVRRVVRWNAEISHAAQVRVTEEEHVRNAIAAGDVQVHFQPIVDTEARRVDGLEALVRLPGAGAQVEAERIIAATRELGLTPSLAKLVCDRAFSEGALLRKYFPTASVGVNVSREFMASGRAMDVVIASATAAGLSPGEVTLELTEEVAAGVSSSVLVSELRRGAEWGLAVVIDDFGRGETALSTLRGLPLSGIKLDRSLVPPDGDEDGWRFVEGIVSLLRTLARRVVAEGVESLTQSRRLRDIGVAMQQGFLFGEPQPAAFWTLHAAQPLAGLSLSDESAL